MMMLAEAMTETRWFATQPWPWAVVLPAVVAIWILTWFTYRPGGQVRYVSDDRAVRRYGWVMVAVLRSVVVLLVLLVIQGWARQSVVLQPPDVIFAIDDSASMSLVDVPDDSPWFAWADRLTRSVEFNVPHRFNLARWILLHREGLVFRQLQPRYNPRVFRMAKSAREELVDDQLDARVRQWQPDQRGSHLGQSLIDIIRRQAGQPTAGIVFVSDGVVTDGPTLASAAYEAQQNNLPIFVIIPGPESPAPRLDIQQVHASDMVILGDYVGIRVTVASSTDRPLQATVQLRLDGLPDSIEQREISLPAGDSVQDLMFFHQPEATGTYTYRVLGNLAGAPDQRAQTTGEKTVEVVQHATSILMVQNQPTFEYRFVFNLFKRQEAFEGAASAIQLRALLQQSELPQLLVDATSIRAFPAQIDRLSENDIVWFGDVQPASASQSGIGQAELQALEEFVVHRGGTLVVVIGPRYTPLAYRGTPLARLLPFDLDDLHLPDQVDGTQPLVLQPAPQTDVFPPLAALQALGWPRRSIPPVFWAADIRHLKPTAILAAQWTDPQGNSRPAIIAQRIGSGLVVVHTTDETYRWRRQATAPWFDRYWLQLVRYLGQHRLMAGQGVAQLRVRQRVVDAGEPLVFDARVIDARYLPQPPAELTIVLQQPDGLSLPIAMNVTERDPMQFEATVENLPPGEYQARLVIDHPADAPILAFATIRSRDEEMQRTEIDRQQLQMLAEISGGQVIPLNQAAEIHRWLPEPRPSVVRTMPPESVWNDWRLVSLFAAALVLLLTCEWLLRRQLGWI